MEDDYIIFMNILVNGLILDEFNNYLIYKSKSYKIGEKYSPIIPPSQPEDKGMSTTNLSLIIVFSIVGALILVIVIFFIYRHFNKKRKLNTETGVFNENSGEILLKSESDNN